MLSSILRKTRQVATDPALRRWLIGRAFGKWPGEPPFKSHHPPYLDQLLPLDPETPGAVYTDLKSTSATGVLTLCLAGETLLLAPGEEETLFERSFADLETTLSLHRFAWLPVLGDDADPAWVAALWRGWLKSAGTPDESWSWHPYTAAERAINIARFGQRHGLPGDPPETLAALAAHAPAIARRLEYFGEHYTSNHLANNGRGLFLLGLWLGLDRATEIGGRILIEEAKRIFSAEGVLREGSSHYQLLLAANYEEARRQAEKYNRPEALALAAISDQARTVANSLMLPGGFPLVGDISPDCPPAMLLNGCAYPVTGPLPDFAADGWLRYTHGDWSGLWHAAPDGWSQMPGHGHQDTGSFELHFRDEPVFVDPGRGAYGDTGDAALYAAADMHSGLTVDGDAPYPPNRPYYDETFRRNLCGDRPQLTKTDDGVRLAHAGFSRLIQGAKHQRSWRFNATGFVIKDRLDGHGRHTVTRTLITPLAVEQAKTGVTLVGKNARYTIGWGDNNVAVSVQPVTRWHAYGQGTPASAIILTSDQALPFVGNIKIEAGIFRN